MTYAGAEPVAEPAVVPAGVVAVLVGFVEPLLPEADEEPLAVVSGAELPEAEVSAALVEGVESVAVLERVTP